MGDDGKNADDEIEEVSLLEAGQGQKEDGKSNAQNDKENKEPRTVVAEERKKINPREENRIINQFLRANGLI